MKIRDVVLARFPELTGLKYYHDHSESNKALAINGVSQILPGSINNKTEPNPEMMRRCKYGDIPGVKEYTQKSIDALEPDSPIVDGLKQTLEVNLWEMWRSSDLQSKLLDAFWEQTNKLKKSRDELIMAIEEITGMSVIADQGAPLLTYGSKGKKET
ncbi:MAG: hypothetical protein QNJ31_07725 [Candidatus Caenarcaniphilales bacterium]|nr:hypothetical protein [Candidatus Caenarcaniphilales bacterium]